MKALSVRQPWASLIADGTKTLEIRTWATKHRGELLICSSKRPDPAFAGGGLASDPNLPLGSAIAVVDVLDCRPFQPKDARAACCPYEPGHFAWEVRLLYLVEPAPISGKLGFFDVPLTVIRKSRRIR